MHNVVGLIMSSKRYILAIHSGPSSPTSIIGYCRIYQWHRSPDCITKTCLYNFDPLKPHFYIVKLGFTGVYIIFLISVYLSEAVLMSTLNLCFEQKHEKYQNFLFENFGGKIFSIQSTLVSRLCLSRITAYLEVKIWPLFEYENLTTGNKIFWKRGESNFSSFSQYFQYICNFNNQTADSFVKCGCLIYFFSLSILQNLICRGTNISKYFRVSLGLWDNESQMYLNRHVFIMEWADKDFCYSNKT